MPTTIDIRDIEFGGPATYRIVVKGALERDWSDRLAGMAITVTERDSGSSHTTLVGPLRDQAQLNGVLDTLYDLHLSILRVERSRTRREPTTNGPRTTPQNRKGGVYPLPRNRIKEENDEDPKQSDAHRAGRLAGGGTLACSQGPAETPAPAAQAKREAPPTMKMTTDIPESIKAPDSVETSIGTLEYFDGVPDEATVTKVYDYLDRSRATEAFLNCIPAMSMYSIREGQKAFGIDASNKIVIYDNLLDSKALWLTANTSTMYAMGWLDMKKDGPTVIELPPRMLGILDDMAFKYMTDLGMAGPDKGKGGKFLVLPPGYEGDVPKGYFVVQSKTYGAWLFMRGYLDKGIEAASANIRDNLKVYPLAQKNNPPPMEFFNGTGEQINTVLPNDFSFFKNTSRDPARGAGGIPGPRDHRPAGRHRPRGGQTLSNG